MLSVTPIDMIFVILNLFVLYLLMRNFLFGPVTRMIESRQKEIETSLAQAEAKQMEAQDLLQEYNGKLTAVSQEAQELLREAKARGDQDYQNTIKAAQRESEALIAATQSQLEAERTEMLAGVRSEVATLALLAAAKVSGQVLDDESDAALVDAFLQEVGDRS